MDRGGTTGTLTSILNLPLVHIYLDNSFQNDLHDRFKLQEFLHHSQVFISGGDRIYHGNPTRPAAYALHRPQVPPPPPVTIITAGRHHRSHYIPTTLTSMPDAQPPPDPDQPPNSPTPSNELIPLSDAIADSLDAVCAQYPSWKAMAETLALIRQELDDAAKYLSELRTEQEERMGHIKQSLATLRGESPVARERNGRGRDAASGQGWCWVCGRMVRRM